MNWPLKPVTTTGWPGCRWLTSMFAPLLMKTRISPEPSSTKTFWPNGSSSSTRAIRPATTAHNPPLAPPGAPPRHDHHQPLRGLTDGAGAREARQHERTLPADLHGGISGRNEDQEA